MRLVGNTNEAARAEGFVHYLQVLGTPALVRPEKSEFGIWVIDEDRVAAAKGEWVRFLENPGHQDFLSVFAHVQADGADQPGEKGALAQDSGASPDFRDAPLWQPTTALITLAMISVSVLTNLGEEKNDLFWRLTFGPQGTDHSVGAFDLKDPWRAITPVFLHLNLIQLCFHIIMFQEMAGQVEQRLGRARLIFLVLFFAFVSNMAEGYFGPSRLFSGMPGLLFGLFGFICMRALYAPWTGFTLSPITIFFMGAWFFLSLLSHSMPIANWALSCGFCSGIVLGVFAPAGLRPAGEVAASSNPAP